MKEEKLPITHPIYGGTLTYYIDLPVGTHFYVENGCWEGKIGYEDGRKTIYIPEINETRFINDSYYAWITIKQ